MIRPKLTLVFLCCALVFVAIGKGAEATDSQGTGREPLVLLNADNAIEFHSASLAPIHTVDGTILYQLHFDLINASEIPQEGVYVNYGIWSNTGDPIGAGSMLIYDRLEVLEEATVSVKTALDGIRIDSDMTVAFAPSELSGKGPLPTSRELATKVTCEAFCERCANIAATVCIAGVLRFSKTCSESGKCCTITCAPPSE